jgi:hypothetical protein
LRCGPDYLRGGRPRGDAAGSNISINKFPESVHYARLQPDVPVYVVPPQFIARHEFQPDTKWNAGHQWKVYSGLNAGLAAVSGMPMMPV